MHARTIACRLGALIALLALTASVPVAAQGFKWWHSEKFQRELGLTEDQISRIEEIFQKALPEFRANKRMLDGLEDELSKLIDTAAEESVVMEQADRVEAVRAELSKSRTLMLVRMRKVLTSDQRVRLVALHEEWERDRKRRDRNK